MRLIKSIAPFLGVLAIAAVAKADTTFSFSTVTLTENKGSTKIYGTVTGDVTIDVTSGLIKSGDFIATYGATDSNGDNPTASYTFTHITNTDSVPVADGYIDAVFEDTTNTTFFDLEYTDVAGVITLCSTTNGACNQPGANEQTHLRTSPNEDLIQGSLVTGSLQSTSSATPEPSSLALFSTGILSLAGVVRRRLS